MNILRERKRDEQEYNSHGRYEVGGGAERGNRG